MGFFLGDGKGGGVVWLLSGSCFVALNQRMEVGWGNGTGVWGFIKKLELGEEKA